MTVTSHFEQAAPAPRSARSDTPSFWISETFWGYIVKSSSKASTLVMIAQGSTMIVGAGMIAVGLGLWLSPTAFASAADMLIRAAATSSLIFVATLLLWHASRGTQSELQIDQHLAEVREVIHNRAGRETLIGRHGFDVFESVFIERFGSAGQHRLFLRYRNTARVLPVAEGTLGELEALRDRLVRDVVIDAVPHAA